MKAALFRSALGAATALTHNATQQAVVAEQKYFARGHLKNATYLKKSYDRYYLPAIYTFSGVGFFIWANGAIDILLNKNRKQ